MTAMQGEKSVQAGSAWTTMNFSLGVYIVAKRWSAGKTA